MDCGDGVLWDAKSSLRKPARAGLAGCVVELFDEEICHTKKGKTERDSLKKKDKERFVSSNLDGLLNQERQGL